MKLLSITTTFSLASLFCTLASAGITIREFPSVVQVGTWYNVEYASDRNYRIIDFQTMLWDDFGRSSWPLGRLGGMANHYLELDANKSQTASWKAPRVRHGVYSFFLNAVEIDDNGQLNPNTTFYVHSNKFQIIGGDTIRPRDIVGIVFATLAGVVFLGVLWILGARLWRKRRSLAVEMSEQTEGGYTDAAER